MTDEDFENLSVELGIPVWFLMGVVVEYLECRGYTKYPEIDFTKIDAGQIRSVFSMPPVLVIGPALVANIHPETYKSRIISSLGGRPSVRVTAQGESLTPEGIVPAHSFQSIHNSINVAD